MYYKVAALIYNNVGNGRNGDLSGDGDCYNAGSGWEGGWGSIHSSSDCLAYPRGCRGYPRGCRGYFWSFHGYPLSRCGLPWDCRGDSWGWGDATSCLSRRHSQPHGATTGHRYSRCDGRGIRPLPYGQTSSRLRSRHPYGQASGCS